MHFNCSAQSRFLKLELTWEVTFPGQSTITVSYYGNTIVGAPSFHTGDGFRFSLTKTIADDTYYMESIFRLELTNNTSPNVRCTITDVTVEASISVYQGNQSGVHLGIFFFISRATDQQYGIRTKQKRFIFEDNSKLHGHTNEHVQFEGAHKEPFLPCRHTDNDIDIQHWVTSCMLAMAGWQWVKVVTRNKDGGWNGVQDITCVFVEVAGSYEKKEKEKSPRMVCSPPVVSKCLGEAHRRLEFFIRLSFSPPYCW